MSNITITEVYEELIGSLKDLRAGRMSREDVDSACKIANSVAQLINAESNAQKTVASISGTLLGSGFIPRIDDEDSFEKPIPQYAIQGTRNCSFCKGEAVVRPDAPSINNLVACDFCLKQESTAHFRKQLALNNQPNKLSAGEVSTRLLNARLTAAHEEILTYIYEQGGDVTIGTEFGESKRATISRLLKLRELHLIDQVQIPLLTLADFPVEKRSKVTPEQFHCGIYKLTNLGRKRAEQISQAA